MDHIWSQEDEALRPLMDAIHRVIDSNDATSLSLKEDLTVVRSERHILDTLVDDESGGASRSIDRNTGAARSRIRQGAISAPSALVQPSAGVHGRPSRATTPTPTTAATTYRSRTSYHATIQGSLAAH